MLAKFSIFLIVGASFFVSISAEQYSEIEELEKLIEQRLEILKGLNKKIENATTYYDAMATERINSLSYLHHTVSSALEKTNKNAVFKGLNSNKPFPKFECVVKEADVAASRILKAHESFPGSAIEIRDKSAAEIEPFLVIVQNLNNYVKELLETKRNEIAQTTDPNRKKKILKEVADTLKFIDGVLEGIEKKVFKVKFSFFEKFVSLCYNTETVYKKVQRENFPKILRCV